MNFDKRGSPERAPAGRALCWAGSA